MSHAYDPDPLSLEGDCAECGLRYDENHHPEPEPLIEHRETLAVWRRGDIVQNPATGYLFAAVPSYGGALQWLELSPAASHAQTHPPQGAVLLVRGGKAVAHD